MPTRTATAVWNGAILEGQGTMTLGSGAFEGRYSFGSRFEEAAGTNPEELLGAAHAGCFSMQLSGLLTRGGHDVTSIDTTAAVTVEKQEAGWKITTIHLTTRGRVEGIDEDTFLEFANEAKETCPVSMALAGPEITMDAALA